MKNYKFGVVFCMLAIVSLACVSQKNKSAAVVSDGSEQSADSLLASIERGACFGACPEYQVNFYKTGFAEYYGRKNVKLLGYFTGRISKEQVEELLKMIRDHKMEDLDSAYVNKHLADFPSFSIRICDKKPRKMIQVTEPNPPESIADFSAMIDRVASQVSWKSAVPLNDR